MEMQQLRYFLAVLDYGSFSRAAEQLGRTQQAISKAIRTLEEQVGARLLDRSTGRIRATAFGQLLEAHARRITGEEREFRDRLAALLGQHGGYVRLGASPSAAASLVLPALRAVQTARPTLRASVVDGIQPTLTPLLLEGELELVVCIDNEPDRGTPPVLVKEILTHEDYRVIAGETHPLVRADHISAEMLAAVRWVLGRNLGEIELAWREAFASAGAPTPAPPIETTSIEFCKEALRSGEWLSLLPLRLIRAELRAGVLRELRAPEFSWQRPLALLYRKSALQEPAVLAMIAALHEAANCGTAP